MMTRIIVFALLLTQFVCQAQTNINVIYSFVNGLGQTQTVKQVSFQPFYLNALNKSYVVGDEVKRVVTTSQYTNPMISGLSYLVKYYSSIQPPTVTLQFTNYFPTNISITVYAVDYTTISTNLGSGIYAYSMAQADAMFALKGSSGGTTYTFYNTNLTVGVLVTNGATVAVGTNTSGLVSTNTGVVNQTTYPQIKIRPNDVASNNAASLDLAGGNVVPPVGNYYGGDVFIHGGIPSGTGLSGNTYLGISPSYVPRGNVIVGGTFDDGSSNKLQVTGGAVFDTISASGALNFTNNANNFVGNFTVANAPTIKVTGNAFPVATNGLWYYNYSRPNESGAGTAFIYTNSVDPSFIIRDTTINSGWYYSTTANSSGGQCNSGTGTNWLDWNGGYEINFQAKINGVSIIQSQPNPTIPKITLPASSGGIVDNSADGYVGKQVTLPHSSLNADGGASFANGTATISSIGTITGNGSGLTALSASQLTSGSIPAGVLNNGTTNTLGWLETTNDGFHQRSYNAGNLTNLNASQLTSLVPEAALPNPLFTNTTTTRYIWTNSVTGAYQAHVPGLGTVWGNVQSNSTVMISGGNGVHIGATNSVGASNLVVEGTSILKGLVTGNLGGSTNLPLSGISTNGASIGMIPTVTTTGLVYTVHNDQPASSVLTNLANNNGGGLTNLNANNLVGTVPIGNLPALNYVASTNGTAQELSIQGTNQFYSTPSNSVIATIINGQTNQIMMGTNRLRILFNGVAALTVSNNNTIVSPTIANPTFTGTPTNLNFVVSTNGFSEGQTNDNAILTGTVIASTIKSLDSTLKLGEGNSLRWQFYSGGFLPISDNVGTIGTALNRPKSIWTGTGTNQFDGLISANVGFASFASNTLAPSSISFPATTVNWTNTFGKNIFVFIDNGIGVTATAIKKNGTTIFTLATDVTIPLQPNEYFSETYSAGSPTATWCPY